MLSQPAIALLGQLASEGVSPWLAVTGEEEVLPGPPAHPVRSGLVHGVVAPAFGPALAPAFVRRACDALWDAFLTSGGRYGRVSVPVDPRLAHDAQALVAAARRVHAEVGRPNVLTRIPATPAGLVALEDCLALGISVDVDLVFSPDRYDEVLRAFLAGTERALAAGLELQQVTATASVPVGTLDAEVDTRLAALSAPALPVSRVRGTAAVAVARQMYRVRERRLGSGWWRVLRAAGAMPPALVWTAVEPRHVSALIGWNTAQAASLEVLESAAAHEELCGDTLLGAHEEGRRALDLLERLGIRIPEVAGALETGQLARLQHAWTLRC